MSNIPSQCGNYMCEDNRVTVWLSECNELLACDGMNRDTIDDYHQGMSDELGREAVWEKTSECNCDLCCNQEHDSHAKTSEEDRP